MDYQLLTLFADGGWMMYPLILSSLIGFGAIIAKWWTLWVAHRSTQKVLTEVEQVAREGRLDDAIQLAGAMGYPGLNVRPGVVMYRRGNDPARSVYAVTPNVPKRTIPSNLVGRLRPRTRISGKAAWKPSPIG